MDHGRRKNLIFRDRPDENMACDFLSFLGRKQAQFITKLTLKYLADHNITSLDGMTKEEAVKIANEGWGDKDDAMFNKMLRFLIEKGFIGANGESIAQTQPSDVKISKPAQNEQPKKTKEIMYKEDDEYEDIDNEEDMEDEEVSDEKSENTGQASNDSDILKALSMFKQ